MVFANLGKMFCFPIYKTETIVIALPTSHMLLLGLGVIMTLKMLCKIEKAYIRYNLSFCPKPHKWEIKYFASRKIFINKYGLLLFNFILSAF